MVRSLTLSILTQNSEKLAWLYLLYLLKSCIELAFQLYYSSMQKIGENTTVTSCKKSLKISNTRRCSFKFIQLLYQLPVRIIGTYSYQHIKDENGHVRLVHEWRP